MPGIQRSWQFLSLKALQHRNPGVPNRYVPTPGPKFSIIYIPWGPDEPHNWCRIRRIPYPGILLILYMDETLFEGRVVLKTAPEYWPLASLQEFTTGLYWVHEVFEFRAHARVP